MANCHISTLLLELVEADAVAVPLMAALGEASVLLGRAGLLMTGASAGEAYLESHKETDVPMVLPSLLLEVVVLKLCVLSSSLPELLSRKSFEEVLLFDV